ncbi:MAG: type III-B CRISPR module-associated protein Cmr3 [Rhodospirillales bacterium]|nr:type III-B CRISPR module-associated protein Cmr3 [Rhodospirillales bacterium]
MLRIGLRIEPLDTLFFRDGRPFDGTPRAISGLPLPQTLAGALRTWLLREKGCDFARLAADVKAGRTFAEALSSQSDELQRIARLSVRGPWLCRPDGPLVPAPAILRQVKRSDEIVRLAPLKDGLPGWQALYPGMLPLWCKDRKPTEPVNGYLALDGLARVIEGGTPASTDIVDASELYDFDRRTGIVVGAATQTAEEGQIYGVSLLALRQDVSFYGEIAGDKEALQQVPAAAGVIPFGGEGRRVQVTPMDKPCAWPSATAKDGRSMLVLTAPAPFGGWKPHEFAPVAAAVPGHVAVSGWDLARGGPKPNRFAVAAGSVYFFQQPVEGGPVCGSLCDGEDAAVGWGTYVEGGWNYA